MSKEQFYDFDKLSDKEHKSELEISKAKDLLVTTELSIREIALKCGYKTAGYFSKIFKREMKVSPGEYRQIMRNDEFKNNPLFKNCDDKDKIFYTMIPHVELLDGVDIENLTTSDAVKSFEVSYPSEQYGFLHEAAVIAYRGEIFAAWYNCEKIELQGKTPIRFSKSADGGKTWTDPKVVAEDETGKILYCPPVFGIDDDKLYMFVNQMVYADYMHSLDLYVYDGKTEEFTLVWSRPIPFKLNTNVYRLPNGKLILPGRMGELDGFPNTPAVLISDSRKIDGEWRMVKVSDDGYLCDGSKQIYPETSLIIRTGRVYMFSRNDARKIPLMYVSEDMGETWSQPISHDIPLPSSKAYTLTLSDGRNCIIGNLYLGRQRLALFVSEPGTMNFIKGVIINENRNEELGYGYMWHYPSACEHDGKLYIIQTVTVSEDSPERGAVLSVVDMDKI